ncbi:hypothetical protein, partial [Thiocapsa sp.]|uniref:hypothetical protein n=1 Tax=Thiocapsa sp. TaxID=2024551 RepID=UPI0035948ECB
MQAIQKPVHVGEPGREGWWNLILPKQDEGQLPQIGPDLLELQPALQELKAVPQAQAIRRLVTIETDEQGCVQIGDTEHPGKRRTGKAGHGFRRAAEYAGDTPDPGEIDQGVPIDIRVPQCLEHGVQRLDRPAEAPLKAQKAMNAIEHRIVEADDPPAIEVAGVGVLRSDQTHIAGAVGGQEPGRRQPLQAVGQQIGLAQEVLRHLQVRRGPPDAGAIEG